MKLILPVQEAFPTSSREEQNRKLNSVRSVTLCVDKSRNRTHPTSTFWTVLLSLKETNTNKPTQINSEGFFLQVLGKSKHKIFQSHQYSCYIMGFLSWKQQRVKAEVFHKSCHIRSGQHLTLLRLNSCLQPWLMPNLSEESNGKRKKGKPHCTWSIEQSSPCTAKFLSAPCRQAAGALPLTGIGGSLKKKEK